MKGSSLPRIAVVTTAPPPSASGQARVLEQLFVPERAAPPVYFTDQIHTLEPNGQHFGSYHPLKVPQFRLGRLGATLFPKLSRATALFGGAHYRMREITTILQEGMVDLIVGCTASPFDLPAAFFASQRLQIPFVAYLFDDPIYQWEPGIYRYLARFWEPRWAAGTAAMIVPNEVLAKDVRARNPDANIHIVRNPVSSTGSSLDLDRIVLDWKQVTKPRRLVYTGSVYSAQASSFRNLNSALNHFGGRFELHVYTSQPQSALIANGLDSVHIHHHQHAPQETALRLQREADILFLPLSFDSAIPEAILSSSPAKLGEYLASGRPILVHAPPNAFTTEMLRQAEAGVIVDRSNPQALVAALNTIESDSGLRQRIVENALGLAEEFRVERAREAFFSVISGLVT